MNNQTRYTDEQRKHLDFLCEQAQGLAAMLYDLPRDSKAYAANMRVYLATVKEIRALRYAVDSSAQADDLLAFAPAGDAL
jgi:hypothetical protein